MLLRYTSTFGFVVLFLGALVLSGCDSNERHREPPPRQPQDPLNVERFEVEFDVRDADRARAVASVAFEAPEIGPRVVDRGLVMAYVETLNAFDERVWRALPYTYGVEFDQTDEEEPAVDYTVALGFAYNVDLFEVSYELSSDDPFVWEALEEESPRIIRVVVFSENAVQSARSLDFERYEAVEQRFNVRPRTNP